MHHHRTPQVVMLDHALDGLGASPRGIAWALGSWAVRRFGADGGSTFADAVVKAVQVETRLANREAPYIDCDAPEIEAAPPAPRPDMAEAGCDEAWLPSEQDHTRRYAALAVIWALAVAASVFIVGNLIADAVTGAALSYDGLWRHG